MTPRSRPVVDDLIEAALQGHRAGFDALYEIWFAAVWSAARRSGADGAAEDAAAAALRTAVEAGLQRRAVALAAGIPPHAETGPAREA
jgi:hypothetical protein